MPKPMKQDFPPEVRELTERFPCLQEGVGDILAGFALLRETFAGGGKLLVAGNGGSAADAQHITTELMKGFLHPRPPGREDAVKLRRADRGRGDLLAQNLQQALPVVALGSNAALITAICNDMAPELLFAQQIWGLGRPGDALWLLSTSGTSENTLLAATAAKARDMRVLAFTGQGVSALSERADVAITVPAGKTFLAQELHIPVYHCLCRMLEREFLCGDTESR